MRKCQVLYFLAVVLGLSGCGNSSMRSVSALPVAGTPVLQGTTSGNPGGGLVSFKVVSETVFQPHCVSCHNNSRAEGNVNYQTYEAAIQHGQLAHLYSDYQKYREPSEECKKISKANMDLVRLWIESGAN